MPEPSKATDNKEDAKWKNDGCTEQNPCADCVARADLINRRRPVLDKVIKQTQVVNAFKPTSKNAAGSEKECSTSK